MATQESFVGVVKRLHRLASSVNGNPRYRVEFESGREAITSSDASFCYGIHNPEMRGKVRVWLSRAGRIVDMKPSDGPVPGEFYTDESGDHWVYCDCKQRDGKEGWALTDKYVSGRSTGVQPWADHHHLTLEAVEVTATAMVMAREGLAS